MDWRNKLLKTEQNLIILYNPYYQSDVIEQHLKLLRQNEKVAFGKIRSKLKVDDARYEKEIEDIYESVDEQEYLQLFLTDYASCFVAKVVKVTDDDISAYAPSYYFEKNLEVEKWFLITDIREVVRDNFQAIRDTILANFTTPTFSNHTYAIYGNSYTYPLVVNMKHHVDYFEDDVKYYTDVFKSDKFLSVKQNLIKYSFGTKYINYLHPNTIDNIVSAEIEYEENISNPLYDFSTVVIKYAKTLEQEIYIFAKMLFSYLMTKNSELEKITYSVQGHTFCLKELLNNKPNLGTYKFLFKNNSIANTLDSFCQRAFVAYVAKTFIYYINLIQDIRNETVHNEQPQKEEVQKLRDKVVGIADISIVIDLAKTRIKYLSNQKDLS